MSISKVATPTRLLSCAVDAAPSASRWASAFPTKSRVSTPIPPGDDLAADRGSEYTGNARSRTATTAGARIAEDSTAMRLSAHKTSRMINGPPCSGILPVQFGICSQQKPGDNGRALAENHLVYVPDDGRKFRGESIGSRKDRE